MSKAKERRKKEYENLQHEGARSHPEKNQHPLDQTAKGAPRHNGRALPPTIKSADLTDEVCDLSPKKKN
jgi:hypothetical protein